MSETANEYHAQLAGGAEEYLRECLRLRGGVTGIDHDDAQILLVLEALAAARREVETWQRKAGEQEMRAILAEREANERGAVLEDVRRVEAWLTQQPLTHYIVRNHDGRYEATAAGRVWPNTEAKADSFESLGRALIEEAGHA